MYPTLDIIYRTNLDTLDLCSFACIIDRLPDVGFCKTETCSGINLNEVSY
jgi:uncharacterized Fe-S radical SAM superfamily protein PflX